MNNAANAVPFDNLAKIQQLAKIGEPFHISVNGKVLTVIDEAREAAEDELVRLLTEAAECKTYYSMDEVQEYLKKV
jgi:hypothetical protein